MNQRFVHVVFESQLNCHQCVQHEGVFNLSASFRDDSDFTSIYWTDSSIYWAYNYDFETRNPDIHSTKKLNKFAVILASNCSPRSKRDEIVAELRRFVPVDFFGICGTKACPYDDTFECRKYLSNEYMFFLAFENSLCYGYITEKLFDTINFNIIPVVYGYANYSFYLPRSAYINVLDYDSPKSLANYLNYLAHNKTAYNSYFDWKRFIRVDERRSMGGYLCEMCIKLHLEESLGVVERKEVESLKKPFGLYENCLNLELFTRENVSYFNITKVDHDIYTYGMAPESETELADYDAQRKIYQDKNPKPF